MLQSLNRQKLYLVATQRRRWRVRSSERVFSGRYEDASERKEYRPFRFHMLDEELFGDLRQGRGPLLRGALA